MGRDPIALVKEMASCNIAGISVVTEPEHFGGSMELLKGVVTSVSLPILHKDFIRTADQIEESAEAGASAVLLIAAMLNDYQLASLTNFARDAGLESLVEAHTLSEVKRVQGLNFDLAGINNRDITVLEVDDTDVGLTETLAGYKDKQRPLISESAITGPDDVIRAKNAGADAVLVGTSVMLARDMSSFLDSMISTGWPV